MNDKHQRFVDEYLIDRNATQAAIRAGYSPKTAKAQGSRLLTYADVREAVEVKTERASERAVITRERVLEELALLAFSDVGHYTFDDAGHVGLAEGAPPGARRAIASIKRRVNMDENGNTVVDTELKLWDKPGPLKLAGKHVGLFADKPLDLSELPDELLEQLKRQLALH